MKNKLLSIAIASALTALWSTSVLADGNEMTVTQKTSTGSVSAEQNKGADDVASKDSTITIYQENSDTTSSVTVTQTGATEAGADVKQFEGEDSTVVINQSSGSADNGNKANVAQGELTGENTGNSLVINTQTGSGNKIVGYAESGDENDANSYATQIGTTNEATLNQDGEGNTIGFNQNGTGNAANLTQSADSSDSTMNVSQEGDGNSTTASQGAVTGSNININILGNENNLGGEEADSGKVEQLSSDSTITVDIDGNSNKTVISQTANASGSDMTLTQIGDTNTATMTQNGASNTMDLLQDSNTNIATLTQNGMNDTMNVKQYGGSTATLTQN